MDAAWKGLNGKCEIPCINKQFDGYIDVSWVQKV
jgi:hypothetical protein